ncbi:hypothetical protein [Quatrionicoccus australiensis]|uniref:hypothetical protein n=1 Tax=Quatrionicoccus australiensis TaxID=138118 RepID=UPI001CF91060|nr:hypothetical protein [Quatrionicoccus australiensis]UCV15523.1 hypothetical protein KI612_02100 [Quatrionicoccus australiensis]
MATVTRKFRDDFDTWAVDRVRRGEFTPADMEDFKEMLRRDLAPGPDQLRAGYTVIVAAGVEIPAAIDDHEERYSLWADFFHIEAEAIRINTKEAQR